MFKKLLVFLLVFVMLFATGCSKAKEKINNIIKNDGTSSETVSKVTYSVNPLTGLENLTVGKEADRPVAIMINNLYSSTAKQNAQAVQAGLPSADIIYETEVEGGVTRLLAVFQDVSKVGKIGTVRSARYVYVDLAMGHNAIYVHHGVDPTYCKPHLRDTDPVALSESNYGFREKNGLVKEHTLYTTGEKLWNGLVKDKKKTQNTTQALWQKFADEKESLTFENTAKVVTVPFSNSYKSVFKYDEKTGLYTRFFKDIERKDCFTGESTNVKNVFILKTSITNYSDGKHRNVSLTSGEGYYCVNGTYTPIKWSKGSSSSGFKFTNTDGTPLEVNAGNSWVCISSTSRKDTFQ